MLGVALALVAALSLLRRGSRAGDELSRPLARPRHGGYGDWLAPGVPRIRRDRSCSWCACSRIPCPAREASPLGGQLLPRRSLLAASLVAAGRCDSDRRHSPRPQCASGVQLRWQPVSWHGLAADHAERPLLQRDQKRRGPQPDKAFWRLEVGGDVANGRAYAFDELRHCRHVEQETTLMCISNGVDGGLMSNARWRGVPLSPRY